MTWQRCTVCGGRYINRGGHLEMCPGPMQRIAPPPVHDDPECTCPPGAFHEYGCPVVVAPARREGT